MRVEIRGTGMDLSERVRADGERRALMALGRFSARIDGVLISLSPDPTARRGAGMLCRVFVRGRSGWSVEASARDGDASRATLAALARAERAVARRVERHGMGGLRSRRRAS